MGLLKGKIALVTGASRGIGAAIAHELAREGAKLIVAARSLDACRALARELDETGSRTIAAELDVSDYESARSVVALARDSFGGIDILINNAGVIDPIAPLGAGDPGDWARCIEVNLIGAHNMLHAALPHLKKSGDGVVVNISSGAAHHALEAWSAYCASKAGLAMLTQSLAGELGGEGIRVYGFQPGTVETVMQEKIRAAGYTQVAQMRPSDHLPAEYPARAVTMLCSEKGRRFAGMELRVSDPELQQALGL